MTMQAIYGPEDEGVQRAVEWLISTQLSESEAVDPLVNPDGDPPGSWSEPWYTGTGFPKVFYLRYHMYRLYFPIMTIARWSAAAAPDRVVMEPVVRIEPKVLLDVPSSP